MLEDINLKNIDLIEDSKIILEKTDSALGAQKLLKEYKVKWHLYNNIITAHLSTFTDKMIDKITGIDDENVPNAFLRELNSFNNTQKILFKNAYFDNKQEIADHIKDQWDNGNKLIQRNSNIYWLQRISALFDTYKEYGYYSNEIDFNKDKLKIQKICCDYLYSGSKEDYKNIKYLASAIKSGYPIEFLLDFSKRDSLAIERTKVGELLNNYHTVQEPTKILISLFVVTCVGLVGACALPENITWAASGAFLGKIKDIAKYTFKIQNSSSNGGSSNNEFNALHKSSRQWSGTKEDITHIFSDYIANIISKKIPEQPDIDKMSSTYNLSTSSKECLETVSKFSKKEAHDFTQLRNINLRTLYIKAAQETYNNNDNSRAITLETIKNLDSLFTVRSFENYYFREFNLDEIKSKIDTGNYDIPEIIRDAYDSVYKQANLHNKNTKEFLSCYTDGKIDLKSFNGAIVKECSDLIKDTTFLKFAGRFISHTYKTIHNRIPRLKDKYEIENTTKSKNSELTDIIEKIKPEEYLIPKQNTVNIELENFNQQTKSRVGNCLATMRNKKTINQQGLNI